MRAKSLLADRVHAARLEQSRFASTVRPLPVALPTPSPWSSAVPISRPQRRGRAAVLGGVVALVLAGVVGSSLGPAPAAMTAGDAPVSPRASPFLASQSPTVSNSPAPSPTPSPLVASSSPSSPAPLPGRRYIVREGDRLRAIARRFETTVEAILVANDLRHRRPRLVPGQALDIPAP
ncbi:MAG: LysM peptidoglycan-binding domain-containing protein [Chloroflexota bacterium]|nr:LysM peptidoglycan-binding domain-containing protein [Chloroflexota bacterium]